MLLEYNVDTIDEKMKPTAIELRRRVAGRKLHDALTDGSLNADILLQMKQKNREERKEHFNEKLTILNATVKDRMSTARTQQQFEAQGQLKRLENDISRDSRLVKARSDVLTDLEQRIKHMRAQLKDPRQHPVEFAINAELQVNDRQHLERKFGLCGCCGKSILHEVLKNHETMCFHKKHELSPPKISLETKAHKSTNKGGNNKLLTDEEKLKMEELLFTRPPVYDINASVLTAVATFPPQKPRNCVVVGKGATYIDWKWEPPVIDGGLAVTDYELSYTGKHVLFDHLKGKYQRWEEQYSILTTRYCFAFNPIAHNEYRLCNLRAGSTYTNFRIRCCNIRGWSEWHEMLSDDLNPLQQLLQQQQRTNNSGNDGVFTLEASSQHKPDDDKSLVNGSVSTGAETYAERQLRERLSVGKNVTTHEPEAPTCPLFVNCSQVTSSCIYLDWSAPFYDGGVPIVDYTVHYSVMERQTTVTARDVLFEHVLKFKLHSAEFTDAVIRNIPPNTDVECIYIVATNQIGLSSPKGQLKETVCRTQETSRHGQLVRELNAAAAITGPFFDSDFYTGVRQRLNRLEHMKQLSEELAITATDDVEEEEEKQWSAILELQRMKMQLLEEERARKEALNLSDEEDKDDDDKQANSFLFTMRQRRTHYKRKLNALDKQIRDLKRERQDIDGFRTKCTIDMRAKEKLILSYKLEIERLRQYSGPSVTSSVLAGFMMQYKTDDYTKRIQQAYETCLDEVSKIKYSVIVGENRRIKAKEELDLAEQAKLERTAKFYEFEQQFQRQAKMLSKFQGGEANDPVICAKYFKLLREFCKERQASRTKISDTFLALIQRYQRSAFLKWKLGEYQATSSKDTDRFTSMGGVMLEQAKEKRVELQQLLREAISGTAVIKQQLDMSALSRQRQQRLVASQDFLGMEEGMDHNNMYQIRGLKMLYEGDGYAKLNKFDLAQHMYEAQIMWIRSRPRVDIKTLAICHGRLGKMFLNLGKKNRAIVEFDRQLSLAREISDKPEEADAFFGLGSGYLMNYDYDNAIRYLSIAQTLLNGLGSSAKYSGALRALRECYERLNKPDKMQICSDRIAEVEGETAEQIALANFKIVDLRSRLVHTAAEIEHIVEIERTTFRALHLKTMIRKWELDLEKLEADLTEQDAKGGALAKLLEAIDGELKEAAETDEREMWSYLVHDQPQIVEVEELKIRLQARRTNEIKELEHEQLIAKSIQVKIKNIESDIASADEQLVLEEGPLMKHTRLDKPFRCIGLCAANTAGNEVTGTGTGGFEEFASAEGMHIHMIDYHSGSVNYVYIGGSAELGHTGVVTCVLLNGKYLFSGSTDETIIAWSTDDDRKRVRTFVGHEGSIVSLAVEGTFLASGGSDSTLRLWDKHTGVQLRIVYGHSRSILSMEIGPSWMLTGSTDTEVRVWKIGRSKRNSVTVDCTYRLIGHECSVTCVKFGQMEALSGDVKGRIFIWWLKTGQILRKCQVHTGQVKCMQFDSIHIVSGGADHNVCITDIATGEVLQTLRGHTLSVIALAFDSERIISISGDNTVRYWQWGQQTAPTDKVHVLDKGETLLSVAKRYTTTVSEVMRWNGITDVRQCYPGMSLIVRKADPDKPTDAEKLLLQKEKRLEGGAKLAEKISKESAAVDAMLESGAKLTNYNRVHKIATDIDFFSLGNRLFGHEKRQLELFPDTINPNENTRSLAGRFRAEDKRKKEERRQAHQGMSDFSAPQAEAESAEDAAALAWALKTGSKVRPRYFVSADNEDEWGDVADDLAVVMLQMMVEYEVYDVVMEQKRMLRSKQSVIGRINTRQLQIEQEEKQRMLEEQEALQAMLSADASAGAVEGGQRFLPAIVAYQQHERQDKRKGHKKATTPTKHKQPTAGTVTFQEAEEAVTSGGGGESPQMSHAAKRQARKEAKEARKAAAKLKILGSSSSKSGGEDMVSAAAASAAEHSGRGAYFNSSSVDDPLVEDNVFEADDGMILHTTIKAPDIAEVVPLPMPPISAVPAGNTQEINEPSDDNALVAPGPPAPSFAAAAAVVGNSFDQQHTTTSSKNNSNREEREKRTEGSVKLPPI